MRTYAIAAAAIAALLLALFGLAELLSVPVLSDRSPDLGDPGIAAAAASFALLAGDVVLPVPSSALMILDGSLFGPVGGTLLSFAGSEAAALLGFAIGRRGGPALARFSSPAARARVERLVERHGAIAIVVTRPVPVVAETAALLAGATAMPLRSFAVAAAIGSIPPAVAYALVGAYAARAGVGLALFAAVIVLALAYWVVGQRRRRPAAAGAGE